MKLKRRTCLLVSSAMLWGFSSLACSLARAKDTQEDLSGLVLAPVRVIGSRISDWIDALGQPMEFDAVPNGFNRHTREPTVLVTLRYEGSAATFLLNTAREESMLVDFQTSNEAVAHQIGLRVSFKDPATLSQLGEPETQTETTRTYEVCGDATCTRLMIDIDGEFISGVRWERELD